MHIVPPIRPTCTIACLCSRHPPTHPPQEVVERYLPEAERLKPSIKLRLALEALGGDDLEAFQPTKLAGTVPLSAGNLPQIHWEAASAPAPPPSAGAALGVPQPEGFDLLAGLGMGASAAAVPAAAAASSSLAALLAPPPFPELPELSSSLRLPAASQATLAKHALLPSTSLHSSAAPVVQQRPAAPPQQQRPLYPELAELEPPPPPPPVEAALAELDVSRRPQAEGLQPPLAVQQQQHAAPPYPQPSPYAELGLGPQEVGVTSAPRPTQPLPPDATCCAPGAVVPAPPPPASSGVAEVKRLQTIRDVHISVALMDEFMRCAGRRGGRGGELGMHVRRVGWWAGQWVVAWPPTRCSIGSRWGCAVAACCCSRHCWALHGASMCCGSFSLTPPSFTRSYAVSNTRRGIETCGILAGELSADDAVFTITTLIVPKQEGTTDTVRLAAVRIGGFAWGGFMGRVQAEHCPLPPMFAGQHPPMQPSWICPHLPARWRC